ncbi:MAG: VWA domain-containing protein [Acidobacteriota bacterium]
MFTLNSRLTKLLSASALVFTGAAFLTAQNAQPPAQRGPTFRTGARLVVVDVVVANDSGPIRGLTKEDFTLEDKGKKQEIAVFASTEVKNSETPQPLPPGVVSNKINSKGEEFSSATVILYDRANTAAIDQAFVRSQVLKLLAALKPTDKVGFYSLGSELKVVNDFNNEAGPLVAAAKRLESNSGTEGLPAPEAAMLRALSSALSPMQELSNQARVDITRTAFRSIARHLAGVPGRKNLVWVVSRFPLTYGNAQERATQDEAEVQTFTNNLTEANITVFPVDPGGTGAGFATSEGAPTADATILGSKGRGAGSAGVGGSSLTGNQSFQKIASATGGKAFRNSNDIGPALNEVVQSGAISYTLGYYPDEKSLDDKVHKIDVKIAKKPALDKAKATFRKEYVAWGPQSGPEVRPRPFLSEVMEESVDATGVGLVGAAKPDPAKPGFHQLDVRVSISDLDFQQRADQWVGAFDMIVTLDGQKNGQVEPFNLVWTQNEYLGALQGGLIVGKSIQTSGTNGVLRVVLQDKVTGVVGSIRVPFVSPKP